MGSREDRSRLPHVTAAVWVQRIPRTGTAHEEAPGQLPAMPTPAAPVSGHRAASGSSVFW